MSKARLTYRFDENGKRAAGHTGGPAEDKVIPLYEGEYSVVEEKVSQRGYVQDYGAWESPFDAETRRIERLIRESGRRHADTGDGERMYGGDRDEYRPPVFAEPVRMDGTGDKRAMAVEPDETGAVEYTTSGQKYNADIWTENPVWEDSSGGSGMRYNRRPHTPWLKIIASVAGAVATGAVLGFFVLSLFSGQPSDGSGQAEEALKTEPSGSLSAILSPTSAPSAVDGKTNAPVVQQPVASTALIQARSYTFLQTGSFATSQAAAAAGSSQQKKGIAAVTETTDKVYLYAGLAASKEAAQGLFRKLKDDKIDVYLKSVELPAVTKLKWTGKQEALTGYLSQTDKLVSIIGGVTLIHLEDEGRRPLDEATMQSVKASYDAWMSASAAAAEGAPSDAKTLMQKMNAGVNSAKMSLDAYKKSPSAAGMWQAQTGLMQTVLAEKELLKSVADK